MNFDLNDEQKMIRDTLVSCFSGLNTNEVLVHKYDQMPALDRDLWQAQLDLGLSGILVPEANGGLDMDLLTLAVAAEVAGAYAVATPLEYQCLAAWAISRSGSPEVIETWLDSVVSGEKVVTLAFSEPGGTDAPETWAMNCNTSLVGKKSYVPFAGEADLAIVGLSNGRVALVDLKQDSVSVDTVESVDRSRPLSHLLFSEAVASIFAETLGTQLYDAVLILHAASAFGAAKRCLETSVEYAGIREQFGQMIGKFQALKHQLAHMALDLEPARFLYWYAAHQWDLGEEEAREIAALCKAHLGEIAVKTARASVEAHGGIGFTWEYPLHIWLKRAMTDRSIYGSPLSQRARCADLTGW